MSDNIEESQGLAGDPPSGQRKCCLCSKTVEALVSSQDSTMLMRIFLECLGALANDDSRSIDSYEDPQETAFSSFCLCCEKYLRELDERRKSLMLLQDRINRIQVTLLGKLISSDYVGYCFQSIEFPDLKSGIHGRVSQLRTELCRRYIPRVIMKNLTTPPLPSASYKLSSVEGTDCYPDSDIRDSRDSDWQPEDNDDGQPKLKKAARPSSSPAHRRQRFHHPVEEISPNEFLYADQHRFYFKDDIFHCAACPNVKLTMKNSMLSHIRYTHMEISAETTAPPAPISKIAIVPMENNPNEFLYLDKYVVAVQADGSIQCPLCTVSRKQHRSMLQHIQQSHERRNLKCPSNVTETAPNEFLYHGKYKFRFIPSEELYACGECDHKACHIKTMLPHIRGRHDTREDEAKFGSVQVGDMEYLHAGKYRIFYKDGRYVCNLCGQESFSLADQFVHIRAVHSNPDDPVVTPPAFSQCANTDDPTTTQNTSERLKKRRNKPLELPTISGSYEYKGMNYSFDAGVGKYKCGQCSVTVFGRDYMHQHIRTHHMSQSRNFICDVCGKNFLTQNVLRVHKARHSGPSLKCQYCDKMFKTRVCFKTHIAVHEQGEMAKKFVCEYCGKRFQDKPTLVKHVRIHTGEKPHLCQLCGKRFGNTGRLFYHRKTVHGCVLKPVALE